MLCHRRSKEREPIFIGSFHCAIPVPSGHVGINFKPTDEFTSDTVILDISFEDFVREWNRQH